MKLLALVSVLGIVAVSCGGGGTGQQPTTPDEDIPRGGTLKLALLGDVSAAFDPQKEYYSVAWEFYRCCLLRTMMTYNGLEADKGGNEIQPDLATGQPTVSDDGLIWTFTIKDGVTFGPPFADVEITSADFVRALEREACSECAADGYSFYYDIIEGFSDSEGEPGSISGLETPDDKTLVVHLTEVAADLPYRFAMPATAPIPEGAADDHVQDYGRFLVASGPYMFEGADREDTSEPIPGYIPDRSITLVRNPSWDASTDTLRPAYVDSIEVEIGGTDVDVANKVDADEIHLMFDGVYPSEMVRRYQGDPNLKERLHVNPSDGVRYISMNIAEPPFDDIHIRKAFNLLMDKEALRRFRGGPLFGNIATHNILDTLTGFINQGYDPYQTPNSQGDVAAAMEEVKQSKYDTNGDGKCDESPECNDILTINDQNSPYPDYAALITDQGADLGMTFDVKAGDRTTFMYDRCNDPAAHAALCPAPGWFKDYSDAYTFGPPLFGSEAIGPDACCNYSLVGAPPEVLEDNGYEVTEVPSVDEKLAECTAIPPGDARLQCWAEADQELMENIVPWVPYLFDNDVDITSESLLNYTYSSFAGLMALDHVAVAEAAA
ncbi:MAG TPA: ABC transporter substrate-binding protein [Actinomycetota bacterium]|nr:ABC transporter substrate-binding protein [Actinomycetota bacterium]